jgi:hypothetical protein
MKPAAQPVAEAGHALLDGDYYRLALDLMAGLPESARRSDYYQARAQMLDASGKSSDAALAIGQALRLSPAATPGYKHSPAGSPWKTAGTKWRSSACALPSVSIPN